LFDLIFWILAVVIVLAALAVILLRDVFRAALVLILMFVAVAGIYILLYADFLAIVQILVYVGAISVLIVVGIMLTRDVTRGNPSGKLRIPAIIIGLFLLILLIGTIVNTSWPMANGIPRQPTAQYLGERLFGTGGYLLQVELVAILLLTAILGAIVLLRNKKK
jgi:NADH:ubiquinone oxidoreductase subunit 6 (subunit J)